MWLGHVVNLMQLARPAMSTLDACYRFVQASLDRRVVVWETVRYEMRLAIGLLLVTTIDFDAHYCKEVGIGDFSVKGYVLHHVDAGHRPGDPLRVGMAGALAVPPLGTAPRRARAARRRD